ncbi:cupin domain-containing protein [Paractinoplanes maris]|uniref:cupin domain-containing protein n=1 Tax=Paractinoplanes maris TaxID=1734446 RepID=UPI002020CFE0|nr:cupin domain-containing protein [Actinoplanes maris]
MNEPTAGAETFWFLGGKARVLIPGSATKGALTVMQFDDTIGHAPPLHVHGGEDEVWVLLDGEISFFVGEQRHDLTAGQVAFGPRGVPHSYLVRSAGSRLAVMFAPAGIEGFFAAAGTAVLDADEAPAAFDLGTVLTAAAAVDLTVAGPPPTPEAFNAPGRSGSLPS